MANETQLTGSNVESYLPIIWEGALMYAEANYIAPSLVNVMSSTGWQSRSVTEYVATEATDNMGETDDLSTARKSIDRNLLSTLSPKEVGVQYFITDRRMDTDPENIMADASRFIATNIFDKVETDLLSNISNFSGGTLGASGSAFDLDMVLQAKAMMQRNRKNISNEFVCVIDPMQHLDIATDLTTLTNSVGFTQQQEVVNTGYLGSWAGVKFYVSGHLPRTGTANEAQTLTVSGSPTGGTFTVSFRGFTTSAQAHNVSAANLQTALQALPSIGSGNVTVGLSGAVYTLTFAGDLAGEKLELVTVSASLTGGSSPAIAVARSVAGAGYATAGFFAREAIAYDIRRGLVIEPDRKPSLRGTELNATHWYAHGVWRSYLGIKIISDATSPVA